MLLSLVFHYIHLLVIYLPFYSDVCFHSALCNCDLIVHHGGISTVLRGLLQCNELPRINESLVATILCLLNTSELRSHIKPDIDLEVLFFVLNGPWIWIAHCVSPDDIGVDGMGSSDDALIYVIGSLNNENVYVINKMAVMAVGQTAT